MKNVSASTWITITLKKSLMSQSIIVVFGEKPVNARTFVQNLLYGMITSTLHSVGDKPVAEMVLGYKA